jgi:SAM-dependent methyltransferase
MCFVLAQDVVCCNEMKEDNEMRARRRRRRDQPGEFSSRVAFWMICFMHDNPFLPFIRNPYKLLTAAGLKPGMHVLEVGCGPGFFTIPAAKMVGNQGMVYAVDVNPFAIKRIVNKMKRSARKNIMPLCTNASQTDFPDESMDLAFLFGLPRIAGGMESLILELRRVLKPGGRIAFQKIRGSEGKLRQAFEGNGFVYSGQQGPIVLFTKKQPTP